ncbi:MAG: L,D-transpeptidase family protein [Gemmatimonadota bacterium]
MQLVIALLLAVSALGPAPGRSGPTIGAGAVVDTVPALIRDRVGAGGGGLLAREQAQRFYAGRAYTPAWSSEEGVARDARGALALVVGAADDGLRAEDYRAADVGGTIAAMDAAVGAGARLAPARRAALDVALTDAVLSYAGHLVRGRVAPQRIHPGWALAPRGGDVVAALEAGLREGDVPSTIRRLAPSGNEYEGLREALRQYRQIERTGGWAPLPAGPTLRPGDDGAAVARLRERLAAEVPVAATNSPDVYSSELAEAVRLFQRTRGLAEDAAIGPATRAQLNVPVGRRIEQIALAMERARWIPDGLGSRYIRVDIPAFELRVMEAGEPVLEMRVIGGRPDWRTPVFSGRMTSVALSPYWNIPTSIVTDEILPAVRRDPAYLTRNEIRVVSGSGAAERIVDASGIDWSRFDPARSAYRLRQDPGPRNPLGAVKFLFPNRYNVYLHDTPNRELFAQAERAFSHGCMRVERPLELAEYVLGSQGWSREAIAEGMAAGVERVVALERPIPVHVVYQTAWIDSAGRMEFRKDLYGHDAALGAALQGTATFAADRLSGDCTSSEG